MGLTNVYTMAVSRIPNLFEKIRDGQAPDQFTRQLLKDWGFTSSNDHALIPILKALGFLSPDGKPTTIYHEYRDHSRSRIVMTKALKNAYADIFLIKERPTEVDKMAVKGKFKSFHNTSDNLATLMTNTFFTLLSLCELNEVVQDKNNAGVKIEPREGCEVNNKKDLASYGGGLHYNIQIHLPATKDVEVYNAIFKSLREHLYEK